MEEFDFFGELLFDEAKFFYEKSVNSKYEKERQMYLHSSLLLGMSALEAYINSVCEELTNTETFNLSLYEKMLLGERKIELKNGIASIGNQLQMSRLIDRIEYIYCKYSHKTIDVNAQWHSGIIETIQIRNNLVHPKSTITLTTKQVERALKSILETVEEVFRAVYKRDVPILNYNLQSVKNYSE